MGQTLSEPVTEKHSESGADERHAYAISDMQGWRVSMEDAHTTLLKLDPSSGNAFFAVFDGHGGSSVAKYAGQHVAERLAADPEYSRGDYKAALKRAFLGTDEDLRADPAFLHDSSGCTAVAALITSDRTLYVANAGDSRSVLSFKGEVKPMSFDHKPTNKEETARIVAAGGSVEYGRVNGNLALSRAIGDFGFKDNHALSAEQQIVTADPDIEVHQLGDEDEFLILACDGIWDCVTSQQAVDMVRRQIAQKKPLQEICETTIQTCCAPDVDNGAGIGGDNMTMIVVALLNGRTLDQWYDWVTDRVEQKVGYETPEDLPQVFSESRILATQQRSENRILAAQQHSESRTLAAQQHSESRILAAQQHSESRIIAAQQHSETPHPDSLSLPVTSMVSQAKREDRTPQPRVLTNSLSLSPMAEQNETPEAVPPTLSTGGKAHESSTVTGLRGIIKPLYSKDHRVSITASCISRALKRDLKDERQVQRADGAKQRTDESDWTWDWTTPLKTKLHWTKFPLIYRVHLERAAPSAFATLREEHFSISPTDYAQAVSLPLKPLSNLGLSGSAFFHTTAGDASSSNAGLIIKSINRAFEYEFMHERLLSAYILYMEKHPGADSLLTKITDVIWSADTSLGGLLNMSPRHYMVMVDALGDLKAIEGARKWDLKPSGFFEPTRDLVPDAIKSDATKSGLADALDADVRIELSQTHYDALVRIVERDTSFLESLEIVDYSLLLGRFPASSSPQPPLGFVPPIKLPSVISKVLDKAGLKDVLSHSETPETFTGDDFTRGIPSADGKWIYRLTIVDFMWNVNKLVPMVMRTAGKVLPQQTITAEPARYKNAFMEMIREYIDVIS